MSLRTSRSRERSVVNFARPEADHVVPYFRGSNSIFHLARNDRLLETEIIPTYCQDKLSHRIRPGSIRVRARPKLDRLMKKTPTMSSRSRMRTALQSFERRGGRGICFYLFSTRNTRCFSRMRDQHDRYPFSSACLKQSRGATSHKKTRAASVLTAR
jgi:hypothetical protein